MARWHVWLTFAFAMFNSAIWMYQGLLGGPRRYAVLPHRFDSPTQLAVPVGIILAAAQLLFALNIVQTLRGKVRRRDSLGSPRAIMVGTAALLAASFGGWAAFGTTGGSSSQAPHVASAGETVFKTAGCNACHTLKAAGASGTVGPNLDEKKPSADLVVERVTNGKGAMPPYKGRLTPQQIADVAQYVSQSAGG
jgi:mono/diheme cytochrome c family protein